MELTLHPEFLRLALKAQKSLDKSLYKNDSEHIGAMFCIHDMLDVLGKEIDKELSK